MRVFSRPCLGAAVLAALLVSACGGGKDDNPATAAGDVSQPVAGFVVKGPVAQAIVRAYPIVNGSVDRSQAQAETRSAGTGSYDLTLTGQVGQYFLIEASADEQTSEDDEATGLLEPLPNDFVMRALVQLSGQGSSTPVTATAQVSPLSEMAVSAAEKAPGGLTLANINQAVSNVRQFAGFDFRVLEPKKLAEISDASPSEQKSLAALLTAVAQMAQDRALNCNDDTQGARVHCVVRGLADSYSVSSTMPLADRKSALLSALGKVGSGSTSLANHAAALATRIAADDGKPVAEQAWELGTFFGKNTYTRLLETSKILFGIQLPPGSDPARSPGAYDVEMTSFKQIWTQYQLASLFQVSDKTMLKDALLLLAAVDKFHQYKINTLKEADLNIEVGSLFTNPEIASFGLSPAACRILQANKSLATSPGNAAMIECQVVHGVAPTDTPLTQTQLRHVFTLTPRAETSNFTYDSRVRRISCSKVSSDLPAVCDNPIDSPLTPVFSKGEEVIVNRTDDGVVRAMRLTGNLPPAFSTHQGEDLSLRYHSHWDLSFGVTDFTREAPAKPERKISVLGTLKAFVLNEGSPSPDAALMTTAIKGPPNDTDTSYILGEPGTSTNPALGTAYSLPLANYTDVYLDAVWTTSGIKQGTAGQPEQDLEAAGIYQWKLVRETPAAGSSSTPTYEDSRFTGKLSNIRYPVDDVTKKPVKTKTTFFDGSLSVIDRNADSRNLCGCPQYTLTLSAKVKGAGQPTDGKDVSKDGLDLRLTLKTPTLPSNAETLTGDFDGTLKILTPGGPPRYELNFAGQRNAQGQWSGTAMDNASNIRFALPLNGEKTVSLKYAIDPRDTSLDQTIGTLDFEHRLITFNDGTSITLPPNSP